MAIFDDLTRAFEKIKTMEDLKWYLGESNPNLIQPVVLKAIKNKNVYFTDGDYFVDISYKLHIIEKNDLRIVKNTGYDIILRVDDKNGEYDEQVHELVEQDETSYLTLYYY